ILAGVLQPDEGEIYLDGRRVEFAGPREAQLAGIAIIFQELNLVPTLSVAENIFLGREPVRRTGLIDYDRMHAQAGALLAELELRIDPRTQVSNLRVGQQQVVEIAKALSFNARIIIMDEPTSALSELEVQHLFSLINRLKRQGVAIIYITHKLDELPHIADDLTVLRDGRRIGSGPLREFSTDQIVRMMVGREPTELYKRTRAEFGDVVLRAEHISLPNPDLPGTRLVDDVSFEVRAGEVLGIFGLMGAGRTELLETLFGLHAGRASGSVHIKGRRIRLDSPSDAIAAGIALAPEDRKLAGLVLGMSVCENTTLPSLERLTRFGLINHSAARALTEQFVSRLQIKTPTIDQPVLNLSGGTQQKVVLAKWLATNPAVLLLDEPTRGIDINAKREIYALIDELARAGLGVVIASSELPEIMAVADRIMVMCEGRKTAEFARAEATEEKIMHAALPRSDTAKTNNAGA
ncbi:MAG: sugar ABC transporter ATP-binding protein, partial [Verrucomicrobiae bacterium]|nr:sugar ABC transporter ATP-binding protein [Verrucomicrobiae bacterium]